MTDEEIGPALPGEACRVPPHEGWSDLEEWVWHEIGSGRIADINAKLGQTADPKEPDDWGAERRLGARFLEIMLLYDPWRSAIPRQGVRIVGALFDEPVNLIEADIRHEFWLHQSRFTSNVDLHRIRTRSLLSLEGSVFTGTLIMDSASIGGDLFMRQGAEFAEVWLRGAKVGGQLDMTGAKVTGTLIMDGASIGGDLFMGEGTFTKPIDPIFVRIGGILDLRDATLTRLDLTGTRIEGELHLASDGRSPKWSDDAKLVLRNTRVGAVQDEAGAWPKVLDLHGFTYERFGGLEADPEAAVGKRGPNWFIEWLARDEPYAPQPYQQCAKVLHEMGHPEMASDVLYAGRERERKEALRGGNNPRATGLLLLKSFVGYGHGRRMLWHPLGWVLGMTIVGIGILHLTGVPKEPAGSMVTPWFFSLDLLLPIIQLYEPHYEVVLEGCAKYYFAVHKLMGYVLASFLIAGLAGLTK